MRKGGVWAVPPSARGNPPAPAGRARTAVQNQRLAPCRPQSATLRWFDVEVGQKLRVVVDAWPDE
jgi:hypothetical protein